MDDFDFPWLNTNNFSSELGKSFTDTSITSSPSVDTKVDTNNNFDWGGVASLAGVIGGLVANNDDKRYKKAMIRREDARVARANKYQDELRADYRVVRDKNIKTRDRYESGL